MNDVSSGSTWDPPAGDPLASPRADPNATKPTTNRRVEHGACKEEGTHALQSVEYHPAVHEDGEEAIG